MTRWQVRRGAAVLGEYPSRPKALCGLAEHRLEAMARDGLTQDAAEIDIHLVPTEDDAQ